MDELLDPIVTNLNAPYWSAMAHDQLTLPHCRSTGRCFWPPSPSSPFATGAGVEWKAVEPSGALRSVVVVRRVFQRRFAPVSPYGIGLIELDAGPRLLAFLPSPDDPEAPRAGDRAGIVFARPVADGPLIPTLVRLD